MDTTLPTALPSTSFASHQAHDGALLREGLAFNATLCSSTGLTALVFAGSLGRWMGVEPALMAIVGAALLMYTPALLWLRSRQPLRPIHGLVPAALDDMWVAGAAVIAVGGFGLTPGGRWLLAATAVPVGISAILQTLGSRHV